MSRAVIHPTVITLRPIPARPAVGFPLEPPAAAGPAGGQTLAQWLRRWLKYEVEPHRASTTAYCYRNIVENHLIPALGEVRLRELTPALIDGYYQWLEKDKGLSPNTIRKHHTLLHTSLQLAFRQGVLPGNPVCRATPPSPVPGRARYYTPQQLSRLLHAVEGHALEVPVKLACYLGLRRSEVLGLRWRDVDLQTGLVFVRTVRTTVGHQVVEKRPKTRDSCRTLSIDRVEDLLSVLRRLWAQRSARRFLCAPDDLLVLNSRGEPWHPNSLTTTFTEFVAHHGLPPITLHGLRHTFASMASNARVPMYQISRALGHSSPATTQRIYTHLFDLTHGEVLAAVAASIPRRGEEKGL